MNLSTLEQKYAELGAEIERLKAKPKGRYKPEIGEKYHRVAFTDKGIHWFKYSGDEADRSMYTMGNCYRTEEEAEAARDKQLATVRVLDRVAELNDGWACDFSDRLQRKGHAFYNHERHAVVTYHSHEAQAQPTEYYAKQGVWEQVIKELEADVKLMLGVVG